MEGIAPPLKCVLSVRLGLESGMSLREALRLYFVQKPDVFSQQVKQWYFAQERGEPLDLSNLKTLNYCRRGVLDLLGYGLQGEPILERLIELEKELTEACRMDLERHLQALPVWTAIPLVFLMFPSFMLLLVGPMFVYLIQGI